MIMKVSLYWKVGIELTKILKKPNRFQGSCLHIASEYLIESLELWIREGSIWIGTIFHFSRFLCSCWRLYSNRIN